VKGIPYVTPDRRVASGVLVSTLNLAGDGTTTPETHVATWIGEHPCRSDGSIITAIQNSSGRQTLDAGLVIDHTFSNKPTNDSDRDYHQKMTRYATIISSYAQHIDPTVTPKVNRFVESEDEDSPFVYADTASSTDGIAALSRKLECESVAIVGLGGTGSYVLDLVAKTPVKQIHLFDGDIFWQHNAFRSPGAASRETLSQLPDKVDYLKHQYSNMHRGIVAHGEYLDSSNLEALRGMGFVFLCLDRGREKKAIVDTLLEWKVPFIDAAMGVELGDDMLGGVLTVTAVPTTETDHVLRRVSFSDADPNHAYSRNIQIADLNALNATLAVIKWKKLRGFYRDLQGEHHSTYTIDTNVLTNDETKP